MANLGFIQDTFFSKVSAIHVVLKNVYELIISQRNKLEMKRRLHSVDYRNEGMKVLIILKQHTVRGHRHPK
jgi:hypothetical protein